MTMFRLNRELSTSLQLIEGLRGEVEQKENIAKMAVDSNTVSENLQIFPLFCGFSMDDNFVTKAPVNVHIENNSNNKSNKGKKYSLFNTNYW